jgi:hypothetical protein
MAAAAVLFVMAGYGFLRPAPPARMVRGSMARMGGAQEASLAPGAALARGDVVATPANARGVALVDLAGGTRAAVKPASVVRIVDPRRGMVAHLARGGVILRGPTKPGSPAVSTPLASVAAVGGVVSVHVVPQPGPAGPGDRFRGTVILKAHKGWARVQLTARQGRTIALRPGQTLILRSDRPQPPRAMQPLDIDELRRLFRRQLDDAQRGRDHFQRQWDQLAQLVRDAPPDELPQIFLRGLQFRSEIQKMDARRRGVQRRLDLLEQIEQDPRIIRALYRDR